MLFEQQGCLLRAQTYQSSFFRVLAQIDSIAKLRDQTADFLLSEFVILDVASIRKLQNDWNVF
jgi:hypothetical protein